MKGDRRMVDIPFTYLARGTAKGERREKWHGNIDTFPAHIPDIEADGFVAVTAGAFTRRIAIVGRTPYHPVSLVDSPDRSYLPMQPGSLTRRVLLHIGRPGKNGFTWAESAVPCDLPVVDGSFVPAAGMRSIARDDRDHRLERAMRHASEHLVLIDGILHTNATEIVFPVNISASEGRVSSFTNGNPTTTDAIRSKILRTAPGSYWHGLNAGGYLRLDTMLAIARDYEDSIGILPFEITGSVDGVDWQADEIGLSLASSLVIDHVRHAERDQWESLSDEARRIRARVFADVLDYASGNGDLGRLLEHRETMRQIRLAGEFGEHFLDEERSAPTRSDPIEALREIAGWPSGPGSEISGEDQDAIEAALVEVGI